MELWVSYLCRRTMASPSPIFITLEAPFAVNISQDVFCRLVNLLGYAFLILKINQFKNSNVTADIKRLERYRKVIKKLVAYPIVFTVLYTPIAIDRFLRYSGTVPPTPMTVAFFSLLMFNGFCNSVLYIWKREILTRYCNLFGIYTSKTSKLNKDGSSTQIESSAAFESGNFKPLPHAPFIKRDTLDFPKNPETEW